MTVYVDDFRLQAKVGRVRPNARWSHLTADTEKELHAFAKKLGLRREWFQDHGRTAHYDVTETKRNLAIKLGAIPEGVVEGARRRMRNRG